MLPGCYKLRECLVFVTSARNVTGNRMTDCPQKHVGVYLDGTVRHYSNSPGKVVSDPGV